MGKTTQRADVNKQPQTDSPTRANVADPQQAVAGPTSPAALQALELRDLMSEPDQDIDVQQVAASGLAGAGRDLPHFEAVQRAFGGFDVSQIRAHVGGEAARAAGDLGARAYAAGGRVAFAEAPDLHTVAHEAAHVVQQRGGVSLSDGVGRPGDTYERHADAVAARVVSGQSAEDLLGRFAGPALGSGLAMSNAVQCAHKFAGKKVSEILKTKKGSIQNAPLESGSPSWSDIMNMTWEQVEASAKAKKAGWKTIKKLLTDSRFDR